MNTLHTSGVVRRVLAADRDDQEREEEEENGQEDGRNMVVQAPQIQNNPSDHHECFCSSVECPRVYWKSMTSACGDGEGGGGGDGRSSHVVRFTPGGDIVAVAVNQPLMVDTRVLFLSPLSPTSSLSVPLLHHYDPSKKGRFEIVDNKKTIVICYPIC